MPTEDARGTSGTWERSNGAGRLAPEEPGAPEFCEAGIFPDSPSGTDRPQTGQSLLTALAVLR
jgi:hypothetical protein